jgi:ribonuclease BN (tRNA processing enzyme)
VTLELTFVGSGDAFGSGGRLQTCMWLRHGSEQLLIDCGASSLSGLKRMGGRSAEIGTILITHLHGDHFAGIPFLVLDGQFTRRTLPLRIVGPPSIEERIFQTMEVLFPGSSSIDRRFALEFAELEEREETQIGPATVTAYSMRHPCGAPPYALRIAIGGRTVTYSGDGEWGDVLIEASADADLFVCEAYYYEKHIPYHISLQNIAEHRSMLTCRRIILTHMSDDTLNRPEVSDFEYAYDGLVVSV